ncbi:MAG: sensor histidine kinase [Myxococcales bacterium]|nr:sensor histidine kinase [Myxococcales bacterium]
MKLPDGATLRAFFFPEEGLDPGGRGAYEAELLRFNHLRLRRWGVATLAYELVVLGVFSRLDAHTAPERLWRHTSLGLHGAFTAFVVIATALAWATPDPLSRRYHWLGRAGQTMVLLVHAGLAVNAQRTTGNTGVFLIALVVTPHLLRAGVGWFYLSVAAAMGVAAWGIPRYQAVATQGAVNLFTCFAVACLAVVYARQHVATLVRDLRQRRDLKSLTDELNEKVEAKTRDLRKLALRLDDLLETERRRLARELHDDLGQELTALRLEAEVLRLRAVDTRGRESAERIAASLDRAHTAMRSILESLRPRMLDEEGLGASIEWLARQFRERTGQRCEADVTLDGEVDEAVSLVVFRVVQESLTNVARHAGPAEVTLTLEATPSELRIVIEDSGRGIAEGGARGRRGLIGMRERVVGVGGRLAVEARDPQGTRVRATVPRVMPPRLVSYHDSTPR